MKIRVAAIFLLLVSVLVAAQVPQKASLGEFKRHGTAGIAGVAAAVRVPDMPLLFTGPIYPAAASGDATAQVESAAEVLRAVLARAGSGLDRVARLTAYVADEASVGVVNAWVAKQWVATPVAFGLVRTPLELAGAKVALEAVAAVPGPGGSAVLVRENGAILPAGGKIFISGQAEKGTDVASAVRLTMAGLQRSLAHIGLKPSDVVQVKAFIRPFADHAAARREMAASFAGVPVPPLVLIEWQSELYAEIELVAAAPGTSAKSGETVVHSWLPWLTASPRYSNIAHVPAGVPLIFIANIDGGSGDDRGQMKGIFERLGSVLFESGSSYRHLAKATYYLGGAPTRALLGEIRGVYFDPTRPPAASALQVAAFGQAGRKAEIDMIAVPVK